MSGTIWCKPHSTAQASLFTFLGRGHPTVLHIYIKMIFWQGLCKYTVGIYADHRCCIIVQLRQSYESHVYPITAPAVLICVLRWSKLCSDRACIIPSPLRVLGRGIKYVQMYMGPRCMLFSTEHKGLGQGFKIYMITGQVKSFLVDLIHATLWCWQILQQIY